MASSFDVSNFAALRQKLIRIEASAAVSYLRAVWCGCGACSRHNLRNTRLRSQASLQPTVPQRRIRASASEGHRHGGAGVLSGDVGGAAGAGARSSLTRGDGHVHVGLPAVLVDTLVSVPSPPAARSPLAASSLGPRMSNASTSVEGSAGGERLEGTAVDSSPRGAVMTAMNCTAGSVIASACVVHIRHRQSTGLHLGAAGPAAVLWRHEHRRGVNATARCSAQCTKSNSRIRQRWNHEDSW
jgi:hypothetical protein